MNWLESLLGNKLDKQAEQTDAAQEFQKKVKASDWLQGSMAIDPEQVDREYNAQLEAEAKILGKTAAYTSFETQEETLKKDLVRDLHILSDYSLSEILMDLRGTKEQNLPENYVELKEQAKRDVASNRKKAEDEVLNSMTVNAQVDWRKAFEKYSKDEKVTEVKDKDLFQPKLETINEKEWSTGKKDDKDFIISDKEKKEKEGLGNGREADERTDVTKQPGELQDKKAYLKVDAFLVRDPDTEIHVGSKITLARSIMSKEGTILEAGGDYEITGTEGERYIITANGKSYTACRFDTPKFFVTAELRKKARAPFFEDFSESRQQQIVDAVAAHLGTSDFEEVDDFINVHNDGDSLMAILNNDWRSLDASLKTAEKVKENADKDKGNQALPEGKETAGDKPEEAVKTTTLPADKKEVGDKADRAEEKNSLDKGEKVEDIEAVNKKAHNGTDHVAEMCPVCGSEGKDLGTSEKDHYSCSGCGISFGHKEGSCGHCGSIESHATKEDVLKIIKQAEVQSPWVVVEKDGQEMIARREAAPAVNKESDEDKKLELQK